MNLFTQMQEKQPKLSVRLAYKDVCMFEVVPPVWSNPSLATNVPHIQLEPGWLDTFDVETLYNSLLPTTQ